MVFLDEGEFLVLSDAGRLINFTYDPNKEAVLQERLKIYRLEKNVDMYAVVSFYQIHNTDVFVEYEIGMKEALLCDFNDFVNSLGQEMFENMFNVFEKEGKIYAIPGQVRFPVMIGEEGDVAGLKGTLMCTLGRAGLRFRLSSERGVVHLAALG